MARKFLTPIDLNKLELQNATIQNLATDPASPVQGQIYYNTAVDKIKVYDGTAWVTVGNSNEEIHDIVADLIDAGTGIDVTYNDGSDSLVISNTGVLSLLGTANEVEVSASAGNITISLPSSINADTTGNAATATALQNARTISVAGDVSGSASFNGTADITINATIQANSVALGTDTTGDYVASITGTTNEIEVSGSGGEGSAVTIGLPNNVTITNDLVVGGNLTVSGSATYINAEVIELADNTIILNSNATGAATQNAGIEVERGDDPNVLVLWNESSDEWTVTNDGTNYHAVARKYSANLGNSASTVFTITHNLNTRDVQVQIFDNATYDTVECDVTRPTVNTVQVAFAVAPGTNAYRAVIVG